MSNTKNPDLFLLGPVTKEMLEPYCIVWNDAECTQKPKRRFKVRYADSEQTEFRDFLIIKNGTGTGSGYSFVEQIAFAPVKYVRYAIYPGLLPATDKDESKIFLMGEFDSLEKLLKFS